MGINKVFASGNLTRDAALRATANGLPVLGFGIAISERRRNGQTGQWEERPNFVDRTIFGTRAERLAPYLKKGSKVTLEGKLRWSQWERDGRRRSKVDIVVEEIELTSASRGGDGETRPGPSAQPAAALSEEPISTDPNPMARPYENMALRQ